MDFPGVGKRIFRAPGFSVPNGEKDIASIYDLLIPSLKRPQNHFTSKFCPVGKELDGPDPHRFRSLKSERIDSPGAACNDLGYFSAFQTCFRQKARKSLFCILKYGMKSNSVIDRLPVIPSFIKEAPQFASPREPPQPHPECKKGRRHYT